MTTPPTNAGGPGATGPTDNESNDSINNTPEETIRRHLRLLFRRGDVFEVRAPKCREKPGSSFTSTVAGYYTYDTIDQAATDIAALDASGLAPGIYITINPAEPALLARGLNRLVKKACSTTSDADIVRRRWFFIDCDPVRPAGTSATDAELALAAARAREVRAYLAALGWPDPIESMSGNGHHLTYHIDLPADDGALIEKVLKALAARFDDDLVKIDSGVANAGRITKVVGTVARKGDELTDVQGVDDRPHRRSTFIQVPETITPVPSELLEKVAAVLAPPVPPISTASPAATKSGEGKKTGESKFKKFPHTPAGVRGYLHGYGLEVAAERRKGGVTILDLMSCPVTGVEAEGTEVSVLVGDDGLIRYRNLHNRGTGLTWLDVREKLEPGYKDFAAKQREKRSSPAPVSEAWKEEDCEDEGDPEPEPATQRDRVVKLAQARYRFGRSHADEAFAVPVDGPNVGRMLRGSRSLRTELAGVYYKEYHAAPSSSALTDALAVLEGAAMQAEPEAVHLRLARHGDAIVLDLGDHTGRAVVVDPKGWQVVNVSPVLFKRTALTAPLPVPVRGGPVDLVRRSLNVSDAGWPLLLAWIISAFVPDIEHPILLIGGQQDAGKSTTAKFIAGLIDPSNAELRTAPGNLEDWAVSAVGSWVVPIDNISKIPDWLSDACCRAVTGDGMVRRALYTDGDLAVIMFQRCLIFTSIDTGALKGDLGRRIVQLEQQPLTGTRKKRPPKQLRNTYAAERPAMIGALLDLLVDVLKVLPTVQPDEFYALADFEVILAALDRVMSTRSLDQYKGQWQKIAADVVDGDPVADAVRKFAVDKCAAGPWVGRASDLLAEITPSRPPPKWPRTGAGLAGPLRRSIPALKAVGVEVVPPDENDKTRRYVVRLTAQNAQPPENGPGDPEKAGSDSGGGPGGTLGGVDAERPSAKSGGEGAHQDRDRPINRPTEKPCSDAGNGDSGRSGGLGDAATPFSEPARNDDTEDGEEEATWTG